MASAPSCPGSAAELSRPFGRPVVREVQVGGCLAVAGEQDSAVAERSAALEPGPRELTERVGVPIAASTDAARVAYRFDIGGREPFEHARLGHAVEGTGPCRAPPRSSTLRTAHPTTPRDHSETTMEMTSYEPGVPSWVDVGTPDLDKAAAFYSDLFGWDCPEGPAEAGGYRVCHDRREAGRRHRPADEPRPAGLVVLRERRERGRHRGEGRPRTAARCSSRRWT